MVIKEKKEIKVKKEIKDSQVREVLLVQVVVTTISNIIIMDLLEVLLGYIIMIVTINLNFLIVVERQNQNFI